MIYTCKYQWNGKTYQIALEADNATEVISHAKAISYAAIEGADKEMHSDNFVTGELVVVAETGNGAFNWVNISNVNPVEVS